MVRAFRAEPEGECRRTTAEGRERGRVIKDPSLNLLPVHEEPLVVRCPTPHRGRHHLVVALAAGVGTRAIRHVLDDVAARALKVMVGGTGHRPWGARGGADGRSNVRVEGAGHSAAREDRFHCQGVLQLGVAARSGSECAIHRRFHIVQSSDRGRKRDFACRKALERESGHCYLHHLGGCKGARKESELAHLGYRHRPDLEQSSAAVGHGSLDCDRTAELSVLVETDGGGIHNHSHEMPLAIIGRARVCANG
mmetsp:Transcript_23095/g.54751  ORF Transcript_23095/g.54751 Transcript_23095/m.54751 type:complete len:252 (+) Transcript_23095:2356-3111(+)